MASSAISPASLLEHIRILSSDAFEGRATGTRGEELTVSYLVEQFKRLGLEPGNPDGSYAQKVALAGIRSKAQAAFGSGARKTKARYPDDFIAISRRFKDAVAVKDSPMVFAGYGTKAPQYRWDDFKDLDVRGKTLLVLVNDPGFRGREMTYYGRWTYKYEEASRRGASACVVIHETGPAGYPYEVVVTGGLKENLAIDASGEAAKRLPVEAWMSAEAASRLLSSAGLDLAALKARARRRDFKPVALGLNADFSIANTIRKISSRNVVARLEGRDAKLKREHVLFTAHWDHLGKDPRLPGDPVYHGAIDNASGVAALLEIAGAFAREKTRPKRSLLFLAVTAEESGLLGARYYAERPLYPLKEAAADLNMDGMNVWGRADDIVVLGLGKTTLDQVLRRAARKLGRRLSSDPRPERGHYFRSDHFEFAKKGVPALHFGPGLDLRGEPQGSGLALLDDYTSRDYHKPSDVIRPDWDLTATAEDAELLMETGRLAAESAARPRWKGRP